MLWFSLLFDRDFATRSFQVPDIMHTQFTGHPDLRRILMWEGYPFHPLRKDFPLASKDSDTPDVAFSRAAPLAGGPFVTSPTAATRRTANRARARWSEGAARRHPICPLFPRRLHQ